MQEMFPYLLNGISVGGQYALIAIGYTLVYGILRLINFAHGDVFMVAGLVMVYATTSMPFYLALPLVLCENLRSECMKWGFVKCEMLLCGAALFIILWLHCIQGAKRGLGRWTVPMMILLLVVGIIAFEVILTAFSWYQKIRWYLLIGYTVLLALLPLMGRWVVLLIAGLLMVGIVGTVVILDKLSWPPVYGYAIMMGLLAALAGLECFAVSRRIVKE